ncbi:MAG TPA: hypothetical protein VGU20_30680 [Stellaceae bacterium]|nr:hypothetical protein [Stellaceae bacterium]
MATIGEEEAMPFDGNDYERTIDILDKLDKVIALLSNKRRWCQGQLQTTDGRYCIGGAMMAVGATLELRTPILHAIEQVTGRDYVRIERFNDHPRTTHGLVIKVLHKARENLSGGAVTARMAEHRIGPSARWYQILS